MNNYFFDNGWNPNYVTKKFERSLLDKMLAGFSNTAIVNSTWYTDEFHVKVKDKIKQRSYESIVLVAMIDAAIPNSSWFSDCGIPVYSVGYYPGLGQLDFWALFFDRYSTVSKISTDIDIAFMCLNRKPHPHRVELYKALQSRGLIDRGIVSLGGTRTLGESAVETSHLAPDGDNEIYGISNDIVSLGDSNNWNRCFLNIVTETWFDVDKTGFVSEKIYKPIVGERPFLVYAQRGAKRWLEERGFETFENEFRDITDLDLLDHSSIPEFLEILCEQGKSYWRKKYLDLTPKIKYNKQRFRDYVQEQQLLVDKGIKCQT